MVELPAPGATIVLGTKLTVVPAGAPTADNVMGLLKPPETVVEITVVPSDPSGIVTVPGEVETARFGAGLPPFSCRVQAFLVRSFITTNVSSDGKYPNRPKIPMLLSLNVPSGSCG